MIKLRITPLLLLAAILPAAAERLPLKPCPDSPNCVSSLATDKDHRVEPLEFQGDPAEAWDRLLQIVKQMKRTEIVTKEEGYLHAEVHSALFGFVDDVEFQLDPTGQRIDVRSASRKGHSDLGVNRKRVERIRELFAAREKTPTP